MDSRYRMLNIGCGESRKKGAIGLDIRKTSSVDVLADARMLPFSNESFNHVYSSHLIEHFGHREVSVVLTEWVRVLRSMHAYPGLSLRQRR